VRWTNESCAGEVRGEVKGDENEMDGLGIAVGRRKTGDSALTELVGVFRPHNAHDSTATHQSFRTHDPNIILNSYCKVRRGVSSYAALSTTLTPLK